MVSFAEVNSAEVQELLQNRLNIVWTCIAAFLVFLMQAGFALLEIGFTRAKNSINIIMKNLMDFSIGSLGFYAIGFSLMFGVYNGFSGNWEFGISTKDGESWTYTFLIFQTVFAATAATIVSGAMAERTKFSAYLIVSFLITAFVYPIFGSWAWGGLYNGGGWLENLSTGAFTDFAGSTVVHSIGGWLALAGAIVLGPRKGKYDSQGNAISIPGHSIPLASLGMFILWFGWFGFNAGSTTTGDGSIGRIAVVTNLSAAAGALTAMVVAWLRTHRKPDASMAINGALAGLVGITAGCATFTPLGGVITGVISGIVVVYSITFIEKRLRIDDPVGAVSVHGVCGAIGTLLCGFLNAEAALGIAETSSGLLYGGGIRQLISQVIGVTVAFAWAFGIGLDMFWILKGTIGLRVDEHHEETGLDLVEHGMEAYDSGLGKSA